MTAPPGELVDALADPARRHAAAAELRRHAPEAVVALRAALGGPLMPDHRRAVLGVLGELKAPDAADALQEALDSADEVVRSRVTQCSPPRAPELTRHEWTALWKANGSYQWNGPDAARAQAVERWRAWLAARSQGRSGRR